ncbi:MAG: YicC family protein [Desulfobacteraceae bacterium]|nr:YicC family protein [Desulfobacteraceae bacterium]
MIKSMTAFAKASHTKNCITADVTIRSYNSRHLDFAIHLPEVCQSFEEQIKKMISKTHDRGRVEIRLNVADESQEPDLFEVDEVKAGGYYLALKKVKDTLKLSSDISLDNILAARNVIIPVQRQIDTDLLGEVVLAVIETAAKELDLMRRREGENLFQDLRSRMDYIEENMEALGKEAGKIPEIYRNRLRERIAKLTTDADGIDPVRLAQEVAVLSDKSDVSEEIVRLGSHISLFREVMDNDESQGRKLNFLIQEFNREFNTIGSKAGNAVLSHMVVDLKSELEKIREQVQNIE